MTSSICQVEMSSLISGYKMTDGIHPGHKLENVHMTYYPIPSSYSRFLLCTAIILMVPSRELSHNHRRRRILEISNRPEHGIIRHDYENQ